MEQCRVDYNFVANDIFMLLVESPKTARPDLLRKVKEAAKESLMSDSWRPDFSRTAKAWFDRNQTGGYVPCPNTLFHGSRAVRHLQ